MRGLLTVSMEITEGAVKGTPSLLSQGDIHGGQVESREAAVTSSRKELGLPPYLSVMRHKGVPEN